MPQNPPLRLYLIAWAPLIEPFDERRLLITVEGGGEILASRKASEELRRLAR